MQIEIIAGCGAAPTALAAFDSALLDAGIANFNLLYLSSIIPAGSNLVRRKPDAQEPEHWGHRLYVVIAQQRETEIGTEAWAGIGWVQEEASGRGLFVEHHGNSQHFVEAQIHESLHSMTALRKGDWGDIEYQTIGITCQKDPVCALAAAVYGREGWTDVGTTSLA
jgi:arginine decarboxylase